MHLSQFLVIETYYRHPNHSVKEYKQDLRMHIARIQWKRTTIHLSKTVMLHRIYSSIYSSLNKLCDHSERRSPTEAKLYVSY